jgi:hypothetical protein
MVFSIEAQTEAPSPIEHHIHTILGIKTVRDQFNKTILFYKALNNTQTTINFLQSSLKSKIIPPTFKIRNTFYNNTDTNYTKISNLLHQTSRTIIKLTIDSLKTMETERFRNHLDSLHTLLNLIPDASAKDLILDKLTVMETNFRHQTTQKSIQKLHWLKKKKKTTKKDPETTNLPKEKVKKKDKHRRFIKRGRWRKIQQRQKAKQITAFYNYSDLVLTNSMSKILNRGLNFYVTPPNLNVTEMLVDYRKFERKMKWKEFFSDKDKENDDQEKIPEVFPKEKSNLPPKGGSPLNNFLIGVKSELTGTQLNKVRPNIPKDETEALNSLKKLQKECQIVIKPCDKGAGIIICNYKDYVTSCENDLASKSVDNQPHYSKISEKDLECAKSKIELTLKKAKLTQQISSSEYNKMSPVEKNPGKFYQIFKVHKKHDPPNLPLGRPIVSG